MRRASSVGFLLMWGYSAGMRRGFRNHSSSARTVPVSFSEATAYEGLLCLVGNVNSPDDGQKNARRVAAIIWVSSYFRSVHQTQATSTSCTA